MHGEINPRGSQSQFDRLKGCRTAAEALFMRTYAYSLIPEILLPGLFSVSLILVI
jgi:hypothetical protein